LQDNWFDIFKKGHTKFTSKKDELAAIKDYFMIILYESYKGSTLKLSYIRYSIS